MTKNPIAFAKQMDDFMASVNDRLDAIMAHLDIPAPGAEPAPDQTPPEPAPAPVQGQPPAEVVAEPAPAESDPPRATRKKV